MGSALTFGVLHFHDPKDGFAHALVDVAPFAEDFVQDGAGRSVTRDIDGREIRRGCKAYSVEFADQQVPDSFMDVTLTFGANSILQLRPAPSRHQDRRNPTPRHGACVSADHRDGP
jgi:hypothetical protein